MLASGPEVLWEQPVHPGCARLSFPLLETNAPHTYPSHFPPDRTRRPLPPSPGRTGAGDRRGASPAAFKSRGSQNAEERTSSLRLTSTPVASGGFRGVAGMGRRGGHYKHSLVSHCDWSALTARADSPLWLRRPFPATVLHATAGHEEYAWVEGSRPGASGYHSSRIAESVSASSPANLALSYKGAGRGEVAGSG